MNDETARLLRLVLRFARENAELDLLEELEDAGYDITIDAYEDLRG